MKVEFAVCCGDTLGNETTKTLQMETDATLMEKVAMDNYFIVKGNHDDNSIQSEDVEILNLPDRIASLMAL